MLRVLRHPAGVAATVVIAVALGVSVFTSAFALLDAFLWRPIPYAQGGRLVGIEEATRQITSWPRVRGATFEMLAQSARSFDALVAAEERPATLGVGDLATREQLTTVVGSGYAALGVRPLVGRTPAPPNVGTGGAREIAIGERLWTARFGGRRDIVGVPVTLDAAPAVIVGVFPESFEFYRASRLWMAEDPMALARAPDRRTLAIARLRPGVSRADAQRELDQLAARVQEEAPRPRESLPTLLLLTPDLVPRNAVPRPLAVLLVGTALLVLVAACINSAGVLLARGLSRSGEFALRAALGAGRAQLVRHILLETLALTGLGTLLGLLASVALLAAVRASLAGALPDWVLVRLDWRVASVALLAMGGCLAIVSLPLIRVHGRPNLQGLIAGSGTGGGVARSVPRPLRLLVVGQVTLAVAMLFSALLMLRSHRALTQVRSGLADSEVLIVGTADDERADRDPARRHARVALLGERLRALPGVRATGAIGTFGGWLSDSLPATDDDRPALDSLHLDDGRVMRDGIEHELFRRTVEPAYFSTVGLAAHSGRLLETADGIGTPRVAVVSRALARRLWPTGAIEGRRFRFDVAEPWVEVVGVTRDVQWTYQGRAGTGAGPELAIYFPSAQARASSPRIAVRVHGDPALHARRLREAVEEADPTRPVTAVRTLHEEYSRTAADRRWMSLFLGICGTATIALAATGLYGLLSLAVTLRQREIGVRMSLGASSRAVVLLILRDCGRLVGIGVVLGLLLTAWARRGLDVFLFRVSAADPVVLATVLLVVATLTALAAIAPLTRVVRTRPMDVLHDA